MTKSAFSLSSILSLLTLFLSLPLKIHALGSGSTLAVVSASATVCGVAAERPTQSIVCYSGGEVVYASPNISFSSVSGGDGYFCGIHSGGNAFLCWNALTPANSPAFASPQRVYFSTTVLLQNIAVGGDHVCGTLNDTANAGGGGAVECWRGEYVNGNQFPAGSDGFVSISSGYGFSCGILVNNSRIRCWGRNPIAAVIESQFGEMPMFSVVAGGFHVCGMNSTGFIVCRGDNSSGQLDIPANSRFVYTSQVSLGANHSCAIRVNGSVVCWGGRGAYSVNGISGVSFESIVSGSNFTCGLTSSNFSVFCWGPGWPNVTDSGVQIVPFNDPILPGPCVRSVCEFGVYPDSQRLCSGVGVICNPPSLNLSTVFPIPLLSTPPLAVAPVHSPPSKELTTGLLVFCIVGSVGGLASICTVIYCLWTGACVGKKKVHNSVQPTITRVGSNGGATSNNSAGILSRTSTIRRQGSRAIMRRQRSGTSSKHTDKAEEFPLSELAAATSNFAPENKLGAGSFGVVYRGKLLDGRQVAIKRGETGNKTKKFQEKESAFDSELAFLSRLHHKHLVRLVGYCEDGDERLLVYEYMKNGALYDHLHNPEKSNGVINSWKMRIKIALDAARGIEYLHSYAVPPIIHRDIKSSNILLDENWTARVSDFGLSLMGPESQKDYRTMKAAGTVGYIDPEYYGLNVLTTKSDVYGLGVVLLELLTGKRAIFKDEENGNIPTSIVDFTVPKILAGELGEVLDSRVGGPEVNEAEAVELVAYTAVHCVNLEGKDRPTTTDIVANLERALSLCEGSHGSISSATISVGSE